MPKRGNTSGGPQPGSDTTPNAVRSANHCRTARHFGRYHSTGQTVPGCPMNKLQMDLPLSDGFAPPLIVKVERRACPPTLWAWKICEEGRPDPLHCSTRLYQCAEDAW